MELERTVILSATDADLLQAAQLLQQGKLVAFATETVYGLGGDAFLSEAVAAIYAAKGRPDFNPLIAHVASIEMAQSLVEWTDLATELASVFWPGPLTLVLPLLDGNAVSPLVTAGLPTLAVRMPGNETARRLLEMVGRPVAAPSANRSGKISPTTAAHVASGLNGRIAAIVDDGICDVGLESTIVGLTGDAPVLLRPGGIPAEAIEAALGCALKKRSGTDPLSAPGQLLSHYAPNAALRLNAIAPRDEELFLGFGSMDCDLNLSPAGDLHQAAAALFEALHKLDSLGKPIAVAPIPEHGLGAAINDRLRRAAAPRNTTPRSTA